MVMRWILILAILVACAPENTNIVVPANDSLEDIPKEIEQTGLTSDSPQVVVSEVVSCFDVDGGLNEFERGRVFNGTDDVLDSCLFSQKEGVNVPLDQLAEYSCDSNNVVADIIDCEFGCESGTCRSAPRTKFSLVENGECVVNSTFGAAIKVSECYNDCLTQTFCDKKDIKTTSVALPWQLSCLVGTEQWVVEKWVDFEVSRPVTVILGASVEASEWARVQIYRKGDWFVSSIIDEQAPNQNRCFYPFSGETKVSLSPGKYEVRIGARAIGPDLLRSFNAQNLTVSFI